MMAPGSRLLFACPIIQSGCLPWRRRQSRERPRPPRRAGIPRAGGRLPGTTWNRSASTASGTNYTGSGQI